MYISCLYIYIYSTHHWFNTCRVLANSIHVAIMLLVGVPLRFLRWRKKSNSTRTCGTWRGGGLCAQQHKPGTAEGRCGERLNKKFRNWRRWAWESLSNILSYFSIFSRIWSIYDIHIYGCSICFNAVKKLPLESIIVKPVNISKRNPQRLKSLSLVIKLKQFLSGLHTWKPTWSQKNEGLEDQSAFQRGWILCSMLVLKGVYFESHLYQVVFFFVNDRYGIKWITCCFFTYPRSTSQVPGSTSRGWRCKHLPSLKRTKPHENRPSWK